MESNHVSQLSSADINVAQELNFIRRDGGSSLFKCGDNVACTIVGFPQRGPARRDGKPTLNITYSRSRVSCRRRLRKIGSVSGTRAALRTVHGMMIARPMARTRIRFRVQNIQHGPSESESAVNATSLALLQSSYDLKDVHVAISHTKSHTGRNIFFPTAAELAESKKAGRSRYRFHFNAKLDVIWMQILGSAGADDIKQAEETCRNAAKTIFIEMRTCAAGKLGQVNAVKSKGTG